MMNWDHFAPPPVAFYFKVHFIGIKTVIDMAFMEVSGLTMEMDMEEIEEGGGMKRKIPVRMKHGNLVCKRPMKPIALSGLSIWTASSIKSDFQYRLNCARRWSLCWTPKVDLCAYGH